MESLFASPKAKRRVMPPVIRRKIVDLKAEHPPLNLGEMTVESAPTQAIRAARLIRRRGVAEGAQAGRVRRPNPTVARSLAASSIPLPGGPVVGRGAASPGR